MFTRYVVKPYPSTDWKQSWGIWDRLERVWYEYGISRIACQREVAILNR